MLWKAHGSKDISIHQGLDVFERRLSTEDCQLPGGVVSEPLEQIVVFSEAVVKAVLEETNELTDALISLLLIIWLGSADADADG